MGILKYPDPRLAAKNLPLGTWTPEAAAKVEEMWKAMTAVDGLGLAAPQIGWNVQLFILGIPNKKSGETVETVVFDPVIELLGEERLMVEGCLSLPGISGRVLRYSRTRLVAKTPEGDIDELLEGLHAHAVQHEMDHLNGMLFIEKLLPAEHRLLEPRIRAFEDEWKKKPKAL